MQTLLTHQVIMLGSMCVCSVLHTCMYICTRVCICAKARGQCYLSSVTAHLIVLRPGPSVNQELGFSKSQGSSCSASSTLGLRTISHMQLFTWRSKHRPSCTRDKHLTTYLPNRVLQPRGFWFSLLCVYFLA